MASDTPSDRPSLRQSLTGWATRLPRPWKRRLIMAADLVAVEVALWAAYALRLSQLWPSRLDDAGWLFWLMPIACLVIFNQFALDRIVLRMMDRSALRQMAQAVVVATVVLALVAFVWPPVIVPRSVPILFGLLLFGILVGYRGLAQAWLTHEGGARREPVVIYGAGRAGAELALTLEKGTQFHPVAFVDDDPALRDHSVAGLRVHAAADLGPLLKRSGVKRVLLAIPSLAAARRREIISRVSALGVSIQTIPSLAEVVSGLANIDQLRPIDPDDLLGRDQVPPRPELLKRAIGERTVLVTGAGGSIGSELCRQIFTLAPSRLLLFEQSEYSLYSIDEELRHLARGGPIETEIVPLLGSVCDRRRLDAVFREQNVAAVFHAAAYKHVPMVEQNPGEGIRNNVVGTQCVAEAAVAAGVERFVLVSTDKAVRPTSVMGMTKRMAELVVQAEAARAPRTRFTTVRFGNVLASSGSVIPLFQRQIARGGPVTVTHREATRFFMTIPEAAQLIIQAAGLPGGGIYMLDMGKPIRIDELARKMIALHGLSVRSEDNPDGVIEIVYPGLRPGEKLHEELSYGGAATPTLHPKILRVDEGTVRPDEIGVLLMALNGALEEGDVGRASALLFSANGGWDAHPVGPS